MWQQWGSGLLVSLFRGRYFVTKKPSRGRTSWCSSLRDGFKSLTKETGGSYPSLFLLLGSYSVVYLINSRVVLRSENHRFPSHIYNVHDERSVFKCDNRFVTDETEVGSVIPPIPLEWWRREGGVSEVWGREMERVEVSKIEGIITPSKVRPEYEVPP